MASTIEFTYFRFLSTSDTVMSIWSRHSNATRDSRTVEYRCAQGNTVRGGQGDDAGSIAVRVHLGLPLLILMSELV